MFILGFILGVAATLIYSVFRPLKWSKLQDQVKDKLD